MEAEDVFPGDIFGKLTVIEHIVRNMFVVQCECCERQFNVNSANLVSGELKSCKIPETLQVSRSILKNSMPPKERTVWYSMFVNLKYINNRLGRENKKPVDVSPEWQSFEQFYKDTGDKPEGHVLVRINQHKGFSKKNCKYVPKEDLKLYKKRASAMLYGEKVLLVDMAKKYGINHQTLYNRIVTLGWPAEKAIRTTITPRLKAWLK